MVNKTAHTLGRIQCVDSWARHLPQFEILRSLLLKFALLHSVQKRPWSYRKLTRRIFEGPKDDGSFLCFIFSNHDLCFKNRRGSHSRSINMRTN